MVVPLSIVEKDLVPVSSSLALSSALPSIRLNSTQSTTRRFGRLIVLDVSQSGKSGSRVIAGSKAVVGCCVLDGDLVVTYICQLPPQAIKIQINSEARLSERCLLDTHSIRFGNQVWAETGMRVAG